MRAAETYSIPNGPNHPNSLGQVSFRPHADGISDLPYSNKDDWPVIAWALCDVLANEQDASMKTSCPPLGATPQLTVFKILRHPDENHHRLFNLQIDGVTVKANVNSGGTDPQILSPGNHTVSETGGTQTPLSAFGTVIGGDCAPNGTINLVVGDHKTCTITNFDHLGGCRSSGVPPKRSICCEPGDGTEDCDPPHCSSACLKCSPPGGECP